MVFGFWKFIGIIRGAFLSLRYSLKDTGLGKSIYRYIFVYNINSKTSFHNVACKFAIAYGQNWKFRSKMVIQWIKGTFRWWHIYRTRYRITFKSGRTILHTTAVEDKYLPIWECFALVVGLNLRIKYFW